MTEQNRMGSKSWDKQGSEVSANVNLTNYFMQVNTRKQAQTSFAQQSVFSTLNEIER
jgi:hypothetical protein